MSINAILVGQGSGGGGGTSDKVKLSSEVLSKIGNEDITTLDPILKEVIKAHPKAFRAPFTFSWNTATWEDIYNLCVLAKDGEENIADYVAVGNKKTMTLSESYLGTSSVEMEVIGINQDGEGTITFQAVNLFNDYCTFSGASYNGAVTTVPDYKVAEGASLSRWSNTEGAGVKYHCQNVFRLSEIRDFVKPVTKTTAYISSQGTSTSTGTWGTETTTETFFLPSYSEMGFTSYAYGPGKDGADIAKEGSAYQKYSSNDNSTRIKKKTDGTAYVYWLRSQSCVYYSSYGYCVAGRVSSDGSADGYGHWGSRGFAPVAVIGYHEEAETLPTPTTNNWEALHKLCEMRRDGLVSDAEWSARVPAVGNTSWSVNLSTAVAGSTTAQMLVIGNEQDGKGTLTFQTANTLASNVTFSGLTGSQGASTNYLYGRWSTTDGTQCSGVRKLCNDFYNACNFKNYIKPITKITSYISAGSGSTATWGYESTLERVFLPSYIEMGLTSYSNGPGAGGANIPYETTGGKAANTSYSYYTDNSKRIKKTGDSGSAYYYWLRSQSCYYNSSGGYYGAGVVYSDGSANLHLHWGSGGFAPVAVIG